MSKYINVDDQLVRLRALELNCEDVVKQFLLTAPAADVAEVRHGRWAEIEDRTGWSKNFFCSECRHEFFVDTCMLKPMWDYCPNCGSRMDLEGDTE